MQEHIEDNRFPSRKNPRLPQFDYSQPNYYFVTICTWAKACIFGTPADLSVYGKVAQNCLSEIESHFPGVILDKWVVMPNHIHAIVVLPGNINLSAVIGLYKSAVTRQLHKAAPNLRVWQNSFHDHVIRNSFDYEKIWSYIDGNPQKWETDCFYDPNHP